MKKYFLFLSALLFLSACASHQKKVLVYANSKIQVDVSQKNITVQSGNSQVEQELSFSGSDPVVLNITSEAGKYTLEVNGDGLFLANLKNDTIVGSMQHTGTTKQTRITQEQLKSQLDSLSKLITGANVSASAKNYFILPGKLEKISDYPNAKVFGPFSPVPSAFDPSTVPETYKFYNVSEQRVIIAKLTEMSKFKYEEELSPDSVHTIHPTK